MLSRSRPSAFTLVELIASAAVITLLMLMLVQMSKATGDTWKKGLSKAEQFRETRRAFEIVTRRLASATLNTYWDYEYASSVDPSNPGDNPPKGYQRQSELRFRSLPMEPIATQLGYHPTHGVFFQSPGLAADVSDPYWTSVYSNKNDLAPANRLDGMLSTWGYFLEVGDTTKSMPRFLAQNAHPSYRCRLLEFREDPKNLAIYKTSYGRAIDKPDDSWFSTPISKTDDTRPVHVVAENIIAMVILPRLSATDEKTRKDSPTISAQFRYLTPTFDYDSKLKSNYGGTTLPASALPYQINPFNQLPPVVQVAMFALDENSGNRLAVEAANPQQLDLQTLLQGLFQNASALESSDAQKGDLAELESRLLARHLNYRLFVSNVPIRGARWSAAQTDQF